MMKIWSIIPSSLDTLTQGTGLETSGVPRYSCWSTPCLLKFKSSHFWQVAGPSWESELNQHWGCLEEQLKSFYVPRLNNQWQTRKTFWVLYLVNYNNNINKLLNKIFREKTRNSHYRLNYSWVVVFVVTHYLTGLVYEAPVLLKQ